MKKLAFAFAAIVAVSFASCGNKAQQAEGDADSCCADSAVVVEETCCNDSCCADSCCQAECAEAPVAE